MRRISLTWGKWRAFQEKGTEWADSEGWTWLAAPKKPSPWSKRLEKSAEPSAQGSGKGCQGFLLVFPPVPHQWPLQTLLIIDAGRGPRWKSSKREKCPSVGSKGQDSSVMRSRGFEHNKDRSLNSLLCPRVAVWPSHPSHRFIWDDNAVKGLLRALNEMSVFYGMWHLIIQ